MAVTTENSVQYAKNIAQPPSKNAPYDYGVPRVFYFTHTQAVAGDATSTINLVCLPAGKYRILLPQSCVATSDFGSGGQTLGVGFAAYTNFDGTPVAAVTDAFCSALNVTTGVATNYFSEARADDAADMTYFIDTTVGLTVTATPGSAAIPIGATLKGYVTILGI